MKKSRVGWIAGRKKHSLRITLGSSCAVCTGDKNLNIHHVDQNPKNNELSNLLLLCASCHRRAHRKPKAKKRTPHELYIINKKKREEKISNTLMLMGVTGTAYTTAQVCRRLRLSKERIRQFRNSGRLPFQKIGGKYFHLSLHVAKP